MKRTLYLCQSRGLKVKVDGPSLWIEQKGSSGRRVPFQMIEHTVILGNIAIQTDVLTALSELGIPVSLFSKKGENVTMVVCYDEKIPPYYHRQKVFYRQPKNRERFMNIVRHWRRRTQQSTLKRYSKTLLVKFRQEGLKDDAFSRIIKHETLLYGDRYSMVYTIVRGLLCQMVLSELKKARLDPSLGVIHRRHPHGLVQDIAYMLDAEVHLQAMQFFRSGSKEPLITSIGITTEGMRDIALRFENRRLALKALVNQVIDSIIEAIIELEAKAEIQKHRSNDDERALSYLL